MVALEETLRNSLVVTSRWLGPSLLYSLSVKLSVTDEELDLSNTDTCNICVHMCVFAHLHDVCCSSLLDFIGNQQVTQLTDV